MADYPKQDALLKLPRAKIGGRFVTAYNPRIALRIVERMAEGETLSVACAPGSGNPTRQTFYRWVLLYPEVKKAYDAAREISANAFEEEALDLTRTRVKTPGTQLDLRAAEMHVNQLRWSAARRNPRIFSERGTLQITVPVQINTTLNMGEEPGSGVEEIPNVYQIDLTATVPMEPAPEPLDLEAAVTVPENPEALPFRAPKEKRGGRGGAPSAEDMRARREAWKRKMGLIIAKEPDDG